MADTSTPISGGDTYSTDDLATLNGASVPTAQKVQRIKVGYGADSDFRDVDTTHGLPVQEPAVITTSGTLSASDAVVAAPIGDGTLVSGASTAGSVVASPVGPGAQTWNMLLKGWTAGTVYTEASSNSTNGTDGDWVEIKARRTGTAPGIESVVYAMVANGYYRGNCSGFLWIRARLIGGGTGATIAFNIGTGLGPTFLNSGIPAGGSVIGKVGFDPAFYTTVTPLDYAPALPVRQVPADVFRYSFSDLVSGGVGAPLSLISTGTGQTINQTAGSLVITTGTTANAQSLIRTVRSFRGQFILREKSILSQRIANNNFEFSLADLVGSGLAYTINSATSVTVTFVGSNPFTAANVGQGVNLGALSSVGVPMRGVIASVSGLTVTFTVAGYPGSGSGTCTLWGWNYFRFLYTSTTATNVAFDTQRKGFNTGDTVLTINTTASPGHIGLLQGNANLVVASDALGASATSGQFTQRGSRLENVPDDDQDLYLFINAFNGTANPATTTTWTVGFVGVEMAGNNKVFVAGADQSGGGYAVPVQLQTGANIIGAITGSGTFTTTLPAAAALADAAANPTAPAVYAEQGVFNGTTWDRARGNWNVNTGDTGAKTATGNGATQTNYNARGAFIVINMGAVSGTTPTFAAKLQVSSDGGTTFVDYPNATWASITATGTYALLIYPDATVSANVAVSAPLPRTWRIVWTIGGTTPSFTITNIQVAYMV